MAQARHVAVLMGGWSSEREVSLVSGAGVVKALTEKGLRVTAIDVQRDMDSLLRALTPRPDVVFNALHGRGGEDGTIQGVLEFLGVPYTHSGVAASAVAMDKALTRHIATTQGVPVPAGVLAAQGDVQSRDVLPVPYVVKPINEGSSVGVRIVGVHESYRVLRDDSWIYGSEVLVEAYIPGRELTVGVMGGGPDSSSDSGPDSRRESRALGVTELRFPSVFFDYTAKYTGGVTDHILPADIPPAVADTAQRYARVMHDALGCQGISRSDFRWDDSRPGIEGLFFLELNSQPGFTPTSLVPEQAALNGLSYADLCVWLVEDALARARPLAHEVAAA